MTERGRLRIYLGAAPGVGKTYEMLAEGHRRASQGADCVIGFVEPHGRRATAAMAEGLEVVPPRDVPYRGGVLTEMDLDAVLARHPQVALVDELAHTNAAGSRHPKRWQDVEELLQSGIDVVTTLNVQHLESLNDVVNEMTGVRQRETVPDAEVRQADELDLVDISPDALRRRMVAGEIYPPNRIDMALSHYFRPGNLIGLRELALLWLADRVDEGLQQYRSQHGIAAPWEARERIVVGVSGGPESDALIRRAARLAARTPGSELMAVYVARSDGRLGADTAALGRDRELVESLGGSWHQVVGLKVAEALGQFAHHENATQLVVGNSKRRGLSALLGGREAVARGVTRLGGTLDVHVVTDEHASIGFMLRLPLLGGVSVRRRLMAMVMLVVALPISTVVLTQLRSHLALSSDLLVYLLSVVVIAILGGLYPALVAAFVSTALADYYFTRPLHSLDVAGANDIVALVVYVGVAILVSWRVELAAHRQRLAARSSTEAAVMLTMAGAVLRGQGDLPRLLELVRETFGLESVSLLERSAEASRDAGAWYVVASAGNRPPERPDQADSKTEMGASLILAGQGRVLPPGDLQIFAACGTQVAESLHQRRLTEQATGAEQQLGEERQRAALAEAASHVLSGPVSSAKQAVLSLRALASPVGTTESVRLLDTIEESIDRIGVLLQELTDLVHARAGTLDVHLRPVDVAEVVANVLEDLGPSRHDLDVQIPNDLPNVIADPAVLTRVITALAANALRRSAPGSAPILAASQCGDRVEIQFQDNRLKAAGSLPGSNSPSVPTPPPSGGEQHGYGAFAVGAARDLTEVIGGSLRTETGDGGGLIVTVTLAGAAARGTAPPSVA
ncbi:MAG: DUF4118 domain-containing protein [Acidimicrobiales bacterium]